MKKIVVDRQEELGQWLAKRAGGLYVPNLSRYIGQVDENDNITAVIGFDDFNGRTMRMHCAGEGNWLNRNLLWFSFHYAFNLNNVTKLIGLVDSLNEAALKFDKHLGFVEEARIKDAGWDEDLVILTMTKEQCKYLNLTPRMEDN